MQLEDSPEIDLLDVVASAFTSGKGVLCISPDTPDAVILASIR